MESLPKIPDVDIFKHYKKLSQQIENENVIVNLLKISNLPKNIIYELKKVGKTKNNEDVYVLKDKIIFVNPSDHGVRKSIGYFLLAAHIFKYYKLIKDYQNILKGLIAEFEVKHNQHFDDDYLTESADMTKSFGKGLYIDAVEESTYYSDSEKKDLRKFVTDYKSWCLDSKDILINKDFAPMVAISNLLLISMSSFSPSDINKFFEYLDIDFKKNNSRLYDVTNNYIQSIINGGGKIKMTGGKNIIYYGAPGTGKSYGITKYIKERNINYDPKVGDKHVFRTTLYPEYNHSDFIGQIMPVVNSDKSITYSFIPGIFTLALDKAIKNPDKPIFLIVEEMSRANVTAVFGDIFQLLDRDSDGKSEYTINNGLIATYVYDDREHTIGIPPNLYIIGTVNTSDQSVFPMDNAFKRRFEWSYVSTKVTGESNNNPSFKLAGIDRDINWQEFYTTLNDYIVNELELNEDKQIGQYFIKFPKGSNTSSDDVKEIIKDKLLQYLWSDVETISNFSTNKRLFKEEIRSFTDLYEKFKNNEPIFSDDFVHKLEFKEDEEK